jgi:hypothetical protein
VPEPAPVDWAGYGECPRCPALAGMPCIGGSPHPGRLPLPPPVDGDVLAAVKADLAAIDIERIPGGRTYRALALWLAEVIDKRGQDDGPSVTAKLAERLQATMQALTRKDGGDGGDFERFTDSISIPVR